MAIALDEPDAPAFERIADDPVRMISAATLLETAIVIETRLGACGGGELDLWLHKAASRSLRSIPNSRTSRGARGDVLARGVIRPALTSATVSPTRSLP